MYITCDQQRTALCGRRVDSYTLDCKYVTVHRNTRDYMKHTEVCEMRSGSFLGLEILVFENE